jgi:hypothetical protein
MLDRSKLFFTALIEPTGEIEMTPRIGRVEEYLRQQFSKGFSFIVRINAMRDFYEVTGDKCPNEEEQAELRLVMAAWVADFIQTLDCYGCRKYEIEAWNSASHFSERLQLILSRVWDDRGTLELISLPRNEDFRVCVDMHSCDLLFAVPDFAASVTRDDVRQYTQDYFLTLLTVFMRRQLAYYKVAMQTMREGDWATKYGLEKGTQHVSDQLDRADLALTKRTPSVTCLQELSDYMCFNLVHKCLSGDLYPPADLTIQIWALQDRIIEVQRSNYQLAY